MNADALALQAERGERAALDDLFAAARDGPLGTRLRSWRLGADGLVLSAPSLPLTLFNRVFGLGLDAGPDPSRLDELQQRLGEACIPRFGIQPAPGPLGDAWRELLRARGYEPRLQSLVQMARDLHAAPQAAVAPAPELDVHEVARDEAMAFARPAVAGFGLPAWLDEALARLPGRTGWFCFVAKRAGQPVAAAALHRQGTRAWLGVAATLPDQRRLGAQRTLMRARLAKATALGCTLATTETGAPEPGKPHPSYSNMIGCGFQLVASRTTWARPA